MAALTFVGTTSSSVTFYVSGLEHEWNSASGYEQWYFTLDNGGGTSAPGYPPTSGTSHSTGTITKSGLSSSTLYTATGYVVFDGSTFNVGSMTIMTDAPPDPFPPSINITSHSNGADWAIINYTASDNVGINYINFYLNGSFYGSDSNTGSKYFGPLSPSTSYTVLAIAYDYVGNSGSDTESFTTNPMYPRPSNFSWTYFKGSGGDFNLTADEWNTLKSKVNFMEDYKYMGTHTTFFFVFTGQVFTASEFNLVRNTIAAMGPPISPPSPVATGFTITAAQLNGLRDSLNSIP